MLARVVSAAAQGGSRALGILAAHDQLVDVTPGSLDRAWTGGRVGIVTS